MLKRNIGFSTISAMLQLYNGSIVLILLVKLMDVEHYGEIAFGISLAGIISTFGEFGFSLMTTRDIPQKKFENSAYVSNVIIQKAIINFLVLIGGLVYLFVFYSGKEFFHIKILFLLDGLILSFSSYFVAFLQSVNRFRYETEAALLNAILLSITLLFYKLFNLSFGLVCILFVSVYFFRLLWLIIRSKQMLTLKSPFFDRGIQKYLLKTSWSFGLHYIMGVLYFSIDAQIIYSFLGNERLALYNAAFRIVSIALIFANILMQVFLPYLSSISNTQKKKFKIIVVILLNSLLFLTCSFAVFVLLFDHSIILILYKSQYNSVTTLFLPLLAMCILRGVALVFGMLLTISDNQMFRVKAIFISLIISISANLYLIPHFGIMGAALASLLTHLFLAGAYIFFVKKLYHSFFINRYSFLLLGSSICVALLIKIFNNTPFLIVSVILIGLMIMSVMYKKILMAYKQVFIGEVKK